MNVTGGRQAIRLAMAVALTVSAASCREDEPHPIKVEGQRLTVENLTTDAWSGVEIWLNDHYRVTRARMPVGERLDVPLDAFVAGFGQRFNPRRQVVQGVEVTATSARGTPVRLVWGNGRRR